MKTSLKVLVLLALSLVVYLSGCKKEESQETANATPRPEPAVQASPDIAKLIGQLESGTSDEKIEAVKKLGEMKSAARAAIPSLIRATKSRDTMVKICAKDALVAIGSDSAKAIVREAVIDPEMQMVLSDIGEQAVPAMVEELKTTKSDDKILSIVLALGFMKEKARSAIPALEEMKGKQTNVAFVAMLELTIANIKGGGAMAELDADMQKKDKDLEKSRDDLKKRADALAREVIKPRMTLNGPKEDELTKKFGNTANSISELAKAADKGDDIETRSSAILCLMRIGEKGEKERLLILPELRKLAAKDEIESKLISSMVMVRLGDNKTAGPILISILAEDEDPNPGAMITASLALAEGGIPVKDVNAQAALLALLKLVDKPEMVGAVGIVLVNSGVAHSVMLSKFKGLLESDNVEERKMGTALFWMMGSKAASAANALRAAQRLEKDEDVKMLMDMALISMGRVEDDADTVIANLDSSDRLVSGKAFTKVKELSLEGRRKALVKLVGMYNKSSGNEKDIIIYTICDVGEGIDEAFPILKTIFEHAVKGGENSRQFTVVYALGKTGNAEAAPLLLEALKSSDNNVSSTAMVGLTKLGPKAASVLPQLIELAKNPELQENVLMVLSSIGPLKDDKQIDAIAEMMDSDEGRTAISVAVILGKTGKPAVAVLIKKLESGKVLTRRLAADILVEISKTEPSVAPEARKAIAATLEKEKNEVAQKTMKRNLDDLDGKLVKEEKK